jgi:tRNA pseudouridine55 synthase
MADARAAPLGCWLVDKPAGPTSHDVIARIRSRLGRRTRVGHAGTLDPFATGLLVVLVGRATRLARYLADLDKTYRAAVRLGATSPTGDPEGPVEEVAPPPERAALEAAVARLVGPGIQRVPAYAAVKVGGTPLYRSTRRGEAPERPERPIVVHEARLEAYDLEAGVADLVVRCSKGTYLRQIAVDLGEHLGCGGYCAALRRLAVGALSVEDAVAPEAVGPEGGVPLAAALGHLERREVGEPEAAGLRHGRPVPGDARGPVALLADGRLVAVAEPDGAGLLRPTVVLAP